MEKNTIETETIELKHPFEFEGEKIEKVYFKKRMKAKDILASEAEMRARGGLQPGSVSQTFYLVCRAANLSPEALEEMDMRDYLALADKSNLFL